MTLKKTADTVNIIGIERQKQMSAENFQEVVRCPEV